MPLIVDALLHQIFSVFNSLFLHVLFEVSSSKLSTELQR